MYKTNCNFAIALFANIINKIKRSINIFDTSR